MIIDSWVKRLRTAGGPGSGNFGHTGRPGEVGGSGPGGRGGVEIHSLKTATRTSDILASTTYTNIDAALPLVSPDEILKNADLMSAIETALSGYSPAERKLIEAKVLIGATRDLEGGMAATIVTKNSPRALIAFNTSLTMDDLIQQVTDNPEATTSSKTYWDYKKTHPDDEVGAKRALYQAAFEHELGHVLDRLIYRSEHPRHPAPSDDLAQAIFDESIKRGFGGGSYEDSEKRMELIKTTLSKYAVLGGPKEAFAEAYQASRVGKLDSAYEGVMKKYTSFKSPIPTFVKTVNRAAGEINAWEQWKQRQPDDLIELEIVDGKVIRTAGGPGSGNFGHSGRPGEVGGSGSGINSPAFKTWFGDSQVVTEDGSPKVLYHSTISSDIHEFKPYTHFGTQEAANQRAEILYEFSHDVVKRDTGRPNVMPVYLSIQNPVRLPDLASLYQEGRSFEEQNALWHEKNQPADYEPQQRAWENEGDLISTLYERDVIDRDEFWEHQYDSTEEAFALLESKGYDGVVYENSVEDAGQDSWIAFKPTQVKSAIGNRGTYDPKNPLITAGRADQARVPAGSPEGGQFASEETHIGITSARPGTQDKQIETAMHEFAQQLKTLPGVTNASVVKGTGIFFGVAETTWVTSYHGNGEARKLLAKTAERYNQDSVLVMKAGDSDAAVELTFDQKISGARRDHIMEMMKDRGIVGGTWYNHNGRTVLRMASVKDWGGDKAQHVSATENLTTYLSARGTRASMAVHDISTEVIENKDYARVQRGLADGENTGRDRQDGTGVRAVASGRVGEPGDGVSGRSAVRAFTDRRRARRGYYGAEGAKRALGGSGSGNFDHSGRPGEVGGSGPSRMSSDDLDELLTEKTPSDYPAFFKEHGVRLYETFQNADGTETAYSVVLAPDRWGNNLYVIEDGDTTPHEANDWVNSQQYPEHWVGEQNFNKDFWEGPGELYHATTEENAKSIDEQGIGTRNDTRGLTNRHTGSAVFTMNDPELLEHGSYGNVVYAIDMAAMKRDGYTPEVAMEEGATESELKSSLAHRVGIEDYHYESVDPSGEDPSTVVIYGDIPKKYLRRLEAAEVRELEQPRVPAGSPEGGQFASKEAFVESAIQRGEAHKVTEDEFLKYHNTGYIEPNSYERYEAGELDFIDRKKFDTLLEEKTINGKRVEVRLEAEPAVYYKRTPEAPEAERQRLYDEYTAAAKKLGTTPMMAGIDLGHGSDKYNSLLEFEKRWIASGSDWVRDEQGELVPYSPKEMQEQGLAPFNYTVGAFVGEKTVGYAGDEFGASGVYVARDYQRHGLGLSLFKTYLEKSGRLAKGRKIGQMTPAGQQLVRKLHREIVKESGSRGLAAPKKPALFDLEFDYTNPDVIEWAEAHAAELIEGITETTKKRIHNAVVKSFEVGDRTIAEEDILDAIGDKVRAKTIAHHESMLAANRGQTASWDQAVEDGLLTGNEKIEFIATADQIVCPICEELDHKTRLMNGEYHITSGDYGSPPVHVNCRCTEGLIG